MAAALTNNNIESYLLWKYPKYTEAKEIESKILSFTPLLQSNYGKEKDCTLCSITAYIYNETKDISPLEIYSKVEKIATKYFYNGDIYGTIPFFNGRILSEALENQQKIGQKYFKGIGFSFTNIQTLINNNKPVILSINSDGRDFYKNHTVTIIGYKIYRMDDKKDFYMLAVYDNWSKTVRYIDYRAMSYLSSITY